MGDGITQGEMRQLFEEFFGGGFNNGNSGTIRGNRNGRIIREFSENFRSENKSEKEILEEDKERLEEINEILETKKDLIDEIYQAIEDGIDLTDEQLEAAKEFNNLLKERDKLEQKIGNRGTFGGIVVGVNNFINNIQSAGRELRKLLDPIASADAAASKYARTLGMTSAAMKNLRNDTINNIVDNKLAARFNVSTEELLAAQSNYMKAAGRNIRVDNADQANIAAMEMVVGSKGTDMAGLLDNFGVGISDTAEKLGKMYAEASKEGLSFEKYSDNVAKNIKLAQNYTFKNGLKGLESMAKKATALKIDMQQVAAFADKVSTVEGAMDTAAKLQVLGGPFAQMADPLGMLNEGLTDMEGLQDRMAKMIGGLGTFDRETGEVKVSAFNKQRIKAAASAMGVSYDSLMESTNAQARRGEISKQLETSDNAKNLSDDMKELIKNSGTFKDGKAGVSIRGQFKSLDELNNNDYEALKAETQTESEDIKDIAANTRSIAEVESGFKKQREAQMAKSMMSLGDFYLKAASWLSEQGWLHKVLYWIIMGQTAVNAMSFFGRGRRGLGGGRGRGLGGGRGRGNGGNGSIFRRKATGAANRISGTFSKYAPKTSNFISKGWNAASKGVNTAWTGVKGLWNTAGNAVTSATGGVVKGGIAQTAKRGLIKTVGKTAATKALGVGAKLAAGVAKGGPLGIIGAVGDVATDALVASGKMKKGGVGHHLAKGASGAASGAAMGAMLGSVIPGIGTAVGAVIGGIGGAVKGLFQAGKAKQERKLEEKLKDTGITVKGKYNRRKLKKINKALETGEISKRMRRKLEKQGDHELLAKIDEVAAKKSPKKKKSFAGLKGAAIGMALGGPLGALAGGLIGKSKIGNSVGKFFKNKKGLKGAAIGMALGGPLGALAGGLIGKSKIGKSVGKFFKNKKGLKGAAIGMALGGPMGALVGGLIGKRKQESDNLKIDKKSTSDILNKFNSSVKPIPEKGTINTYGGVDKSNNNIHIKTDPHDINLNGTLKLQGENGQSVDMVKELKNNPQMMRELTGMISNEMGVLEHGANKSYR